MRKVWHVRRATKGGPARAGKVPGRGWKPTDPAPLPWQRVPLGHHLRHVEATVVMLRTTPYFPLAGLARIA